MKGIYIPPVGWLETLLYGQVDDFTDMTIPRETSDDEYQYGSSWTDRSRQRVDEMIERHGSREEVLNRIDQGYIGLSSDWKGDVLHYLQNPGGGGTSSSGRDDDDDGGASISGPSGGSGNASGGGSPTSRTDDRDDPPPERRRRYRYDDDDDYDYSRKRPSVVPPPSPSAVATGLEAHADEGNDALDTDLWGETFREEEERALVQGLGDERREFLNQEQDAERQRSSKEKQEKERRRDHLYDALWYSKSTQDLTEEQLELLYAQLDGLRHSGVSGDELYQTISQTEVVSGMDEQQRATFLRDVETAQSSSTAMQDMGVGSFGTGSEIEPHVPDPTRLFDRDPGRALDERVEDLDGTALAGELERRKEEGGGVWRRDSETGEMVHVPDDDVPRWTERPYAPDPTRLFDRDPGVEVREEDLRDEVGPAALAGELERRKAEGGGVWRRDSETGEMVQVPDEEVRRWMERPHVPGPTRLFDRDPGRTFDERVGNNGDIEERENLLDRYAKAAGVEGEALDSFSIGPDVGDGRPLVDTREGVRRRNTETGDSTLESPEPELTEPGQEWTRTDGSTWIMSPELLQELRDAGASDEDIQQAVLDATATAPPPPTALPPSQDPRDRNRVTEPISFGNPRLANTRDGLRAAREQRNAERRAAATAAEDEAEVSEPSLTDEDVGRLWAAHLRTQGPLRQGDPVPEDLEIEQGPDGSWLLTYGQDRVVPNRSYIQRTNRFGEPVVRGPADTTFSEQQLGVLVQNMLDAQSSDFDKSVNPADFRAERRDDGWWITYREGGRNRPSSGFLRTDGQIQELLGRDNTAVVLTENEPSDATDAPPSHPFAPGATFARPLFPEGEPLGRRGDQPRFARYQLEPNNPFALGARFADGAGNEATAAPSNPFANVSPGGSDATLPGDPAGQPATPPTPGSVGSPARESSQGPESLVVKTGQETVWVDESSGYEEYEFERMDPERAQAIWTEFRDAWDEDNLGQPFHLESYIKEARGQAVQTWTEDGEERSGEALWLIREMADDLGLSQDAADALYDQAQRQRDTENKASRRARAERKKEFEAERDELREILIDDMNAAIEDSGVHTLDKSDEALLGIEGAQAGDTVRMGSDGQLLLTQAPLPSAPEMPAQPEEAITQEDAPDSGSLPIDQMDQDAVLEYPDGTTVTVREYQLDVQSRYAETFGEDSLEEGLSTEQMADALGIKAEERNQQIERQNEQQEREYITQGVDLLESQGIDTSEMTDDQIRELIPDVGAAAERQYEREVDEFTLATARQWAESTGADTEGMTTAQIAETYRDEIIETATEDAAREIRVERRNEIDRLGLAPSATDADIVRAQIREAAADIGVDTEGMTSAEIASTLGDQIAATAEDDAERADRVEVRRVADTLGLPPSATAEDVTTEIDRRERLASIAGAVDEDRGGERQ